MLDVTAYEELRFRPEPGEPVMFQKWRSLSFLHFSCEPEEIQKLLPPGLTVDTFPDENGVEKAWVGLVAFRMEGVKKRGLPAIPGTSAFPETNVRTYVHQDGKNPGVWFFSLDAGSGLACSVAKQLFKLPYHSAKMRVVEAEDTFTYTSKRDSDASRCNFTCKVVSPMPLARPGTLEFFLVERYLLYALRDGHLYTGRVYHRHYPILKGTAEDVDETLVKAAGIEPRVFEHVLFSFGVDVEVYGLSR